jgi:hypothetical protein
MEGNGHGFTKELSQHSSFMENRTKKPVRIVSVPGEIQL